MYGEARVPLARTVRTLHVREKITDLLMRVCLPWSGINSIVAGACFIMLHPHPGFPTFARLDDICGPCQGFDSEDLPLPGSAADIALHAKEDKVRLQEAARLREETLHLNLSKRRLAAIAALTAVMFIAAASLHWRRRR